MTHNEESILKEIRRCRAEVEDLRNQCRELSERLGENHERLSRRERLWDEVQRAARRLPLSDGAAAEAGLPDLFDQVSREIEETSFDEVFGAWTSPAGTGSGNGTVTVIPGPSVHNTCTPQVVVFLRSKDPSAPESDCDPIETLKYILEKCRLTRGVLFVVEWRAAHRIDASLLAWIELWRARGIAFMVAVNAPSRNSLHVIPV